MRITALRYYRLFLAANEDNNGLKSYYAEKALVEMTHYYARSANFEAAYAIRQLHNFLETDLINDLPDDKCFAVPIHDSIVDPLPRAWEFNYSLDVVSRLQSALMEQYSITDFFNEISEPNLRNSDDTDLAIRFTQSDRDNADIVVFRIFSEGDQTYLVVKKLNPTCQFWY